MRTRKTEVWLVEVEFLDHFAMEGEKDHRFVLTIPGYLWAEDAEYYYLCRCLVNDFEDDNSESFAVLKSTLLKPIRRIKRLNR